ncbi:MAG: hypothetical protein IH597_01560 [Bacteroidales bacterium]|nr:hypothetical protein [Bacteroidales bacterium]
MKGQKNEILKRPESRHSSQPDVSYFFATAHFLKQLPTHIAHIAKATQAYATTNALSKSAILLTHEKKLTLLIINTFI